MTYRRRAPAERLRTGDRARRLLMKKASPSLPPRERYAHNPPPRLPLPDGAALLFIAASLWAALALILWWLALVGAIRIPGPLEALDWHVHELLYGFAPAVVFGYMLSMVANWSGRLPVAGRPRTVVLVLWLAGRAAMLVVPPRWFALAAAIDAAFLLLAFATVAREAVKGRDRRTGRLLVPLGTLLAGNLVFLWQAGSGAPAASGAGTRIGIGAMVLLLSLVAGLLVPSFTRGWFSQQRRPQMPRPWPALDNATNIATGLALLVWLLVPRHPASGVVLVAAGLVQAVRWLRWHGWRSFREPLVLALQAGYGFVPLGFVLVGGLILADPADPLAAGDALHAWTVGAIGLTMLAMMVRVAMRRARLDVQADAVIAALLACLFLAAAVRSVGGAGSGLALGLAAAGWIIAWLGYAWRFAPGLAAPPPARNQG